jgi:methylation protein EvaC
VDDNPMKHGYLTPGQHIPIRSPASLTDEDADLAVVLLAWNFAAEIVGKIRRWRPNRADRVIHYVPKVRVSEISEGSAAASFKRNA